MTPEDLDRVLALQLRINQHLFSTACRPAADNSHFFLDLVAVAHLIKFSWPLGASLVRSTHLSSLIDSHATTTAQQLDQPLGPGPRPSSPWPAPDDPAQCAALLLAADELLSHRHKGDAALRDGVQPLARSAFNRLTPNLAAGFRRMDFSPILARAMARKINGFYHAGGHQSSRLRAPSRDCRFGAEHVPALLPAAWLDTHFSELRDRVGSITAWNTRHLCRAASLKLVEMTADGTWPECAATLHTRWSTAQQSLKILKRILDPIDSWDVFDRAVKQVAWDLDSMTHPIDYANRRRLLSSWHLSDALWRHLCDGFKTLRHSWTSPSPTSATALLWAHVTQGDYLHSPALNALRDSGGDTAPVVAAVNQILRATHDRKGEKALLADQIERYACHLALACDQSHGSQRVTDRLLGKQLT